MSANPDHLLFIPLGGTGEIGMNLNVYGLDGKWLIVDMGVSFADDQTPGLDVFMADPSFLEQRKDDILGIVITHGHEDHIGAVAHLWPRFGCPIYASPFTAALLRGKLAEAGLALEAPVTVVNQGERFEKGPFEIELIRLSHSIPEASCLSIRTRHGVVLHTGDWKFDPDPLISPPSDKERLRELGDQGVLAVIGDSTNVLTPGHSGSEAKVRDSLIELFGRYRQRIAVACFATNVARLSSIAHAAKRCGRHVALCGRSLRRIDQAARETGYLADCDPFLSEEEGALLPPSKVVYICTGSQGEPRAALLRIAHGAHPRISLDPGDVVIFSSRIIPGRERSIFRLQNQLAKRGIEIVTEKDHFVHVSGHPAEGEVREFYALTRPAAAVPTHGEIRHLQAHAALAREMGVGETQLLEDGAILKLAPGVLEIVGAAPVGRIALDGTRLVGTEAETLKQRVRMMWNGAVFVTVAMTAAGALSGDPIISAPGLTEDEFDLEEALWAVREEIEDLPLSARRNDALTQEAAYRAARRCFKQAFGKKPVTEVHLVRR